MTTTEKIRDHLAQHGNTWTTTAGSLYLTALAIAIAAALWRMI